MKSVASASCCICSSNLRQSMYVCPYKCEVKAQWDWRRQFLLICAFVLGQRNSSAIAQNTVDFHRIEGLQEACVISQHLERLP
jgi:hypothetical protein